jgi:cyclic pyranopterin phosphate synthase
MKMIAITTTGVILSPQLGKLVSCGLTSVNISLDTLREDRFEAITRRDRKNFRSVMRSINEALGAGVKVKINCVIMRGVNDDEILSFIKLSKDIGVDIRFIEMMPFDDNEWNAKKLVSYFDILKTIGDAGIPLIKAPSTDPHDTSKWYEIPGHENRIGFITSMSNNFCGTCNRLRITSDGKLKVCLFGDESFSLLQTMRGNQALRIPIKT